MSTLNLAITANGDDGYALTGFFSNSETVLLTGASTVPIGMFLRFLNVTIPPGVTIDSAALDLTAVSSSGTITDVHIKQKGNDIDDAVAPTDVAGFNALVRTTAAVDWDPSAWTASTTYTLPDISAIIQEIIDRPGWASGNDILIILDDDGSSTNSFVRAAAIDHATIQEPRLNITYTLAGEAAVAVNVAISATGRAYMQGTASISANVAVSSTGRGYGVGQAAVPVSVVISAKGGPHGSAAVDLSVQVSATGRKYHSGQAAILIEIFHALSGRKFIPPSPFTFRSTLRYGPRYGRLRGNR